MGRKRANYQQSIATDNITALSHEGRGVSNVNGKTTFLRAALPGEAVLFRYQKLHRQYDEGYVIEVIKANPERIVPRCLHFDSCGGCALQHITSEKQIEHKQKVLLEQLAHYGHCQPNSVLPPLAGQSWEYRGKARLGVRFVPQKGGMLIGFREHSNPRLLTDIASCPILDTRVNRLLPGLRECLLELSIKEQIPQIEIATGDNSVAFIIRHLVALPETDQQRLIAFAKQHQIRMLSQPNKPDPIVCLWPEAPVESLYYDLPEFNCRMYFEPLDFTQVNASLNQKMVSQVISLLDPQPDEYVLDLFCGLGNFTLPIARRAKGVVGVEGLEAMVTRAYANAKYNDIHNAEFYTHDLATPITHTHWGNKAYTKLLLDPPRTGAAEILPRLLGMGIKRIVYVSCNPATLARDSATLINNGYRLEQAGVMDMFPHTTHVESIALFEKKG